MGLVVESVAAAVILGGAIFAILAIPRGTDRPAAGALGPTSAMAAVCSPDPRATGFLTTDGNFNQTTGAPVRIDSATGDISSATVYAFISQLNGTNDGGSSGEKSCGNPVYRYGGLLWLTNPSTATITWGAFTKNANSGSCYLIWGTTDYMHANWNPGPCTWQAGQTPGINYRVLPISLTPGLRYQNDSNLDTTGDFEYVWDSCSTWYESSPDTAKVVKSGVPKTDLDNVVSNTTAISWKPGANCGGALTQDGTGTAQSFVYDNSAPTITWATPAADASDTTGAITPAWVVADPESGVDTAGTVKRQYTSLAGNVCGGTWTTDATQTNGAATSLVSGRCYRWTFDPALATGAVKPTNNANTAATTNWTSHIVKVDTSAPSSPAVTSSAAAGSYRSGDTIYFRPSTASTITLTSDGDDPVSGIANSTFGALSATTGWTYTSGIVAGDPAAKNLTWSASAVSASLAITTTNNHGLTSAARTISFNADGTAPSAAYTYPTVDVYQTSTGSFTVTWTETEAGAGVGTRSAQWQSAPLGNGTCGTPNTPEAPITPSAGSAPRSLVNQGTCYRLLLTLTDNAGNASGTLISAWVKIDNSGPTISWTTPAASAYNTTGSINPAWAVADPESGTAVTGTVIRQWAALVANACGSSWTAEATQTNGAATSLVSGRCYRWTFDPALATGAVKPTNNANTAATTNWTSAVVKVDTSAPVINWTTPSSDAYDTTGTINPAWTVTDAESGVTGAGTVRRQYATLAANACGAWTTEATQTNGAGTALVSGRCYRWTFDPALDAGAVKPVNGAGSLAATNVTSGIVKVDASAPAAPAISDNNPAGTYHASPTSIFFRPSAAGTIAVTSTGTDLESGIAGSTFGALTAPTGWTYTSGFVSGNPASKNLTWSGTAGTSSMPITTSNGTGGLSPAITLVLTADPTAPTITGFNASLAGTTATVTWTETETGSGVGTRSLQRRLLQAADSSACSAPDSSYGNDGTASSTPSPATPVLAAGYCYRWLLLVTDRVGNASAQAMSNVVYVPPAVPNLVVTDNTAYAELTCTVPTGTNTCTLGTTSLPVTASTIYLWSSTVTNCSSSTTTLFITINTGFREDHHHGGYWDGGPFTQTVVTALSTPASGIGTSGGIFVKMDGAATGCTATAKFAWAWAGTPWPRPAAWRTGDGVYVKGDTAGSFALTATGTGSIASNTFGALTDSPTGWSPVGAQSSAANPYSVTYGWTTGATQTSTSVTTQNTSGTNSAPYTIGFDPDVAPPLVGFVEPASNAPPIQVGTTYTVAFNVSDDLSGFGPFGSGWRMRRQIATVSGGYCGAFANEIQDRQSYNGQILAWGTSSGTSLSSTQSLVSGKCYRWLLEATDSVGNVSYQALSGSILVDSTPGPQRDLHVTARPNARVGEAVWVVVAPYDHASGEPLANYTGTVSIAASVGASAVFPDGSSAILTPSTGKLGHAFRVLLGPGDHTVTVSGTGIQSGQVTVHVDTSTLSASANAVAWVGVPSTVNVGARAIDGTAIPTYNGQLTFTSSDTILTYGSGIDGNRHFRMPCGCEGGHDFSVTFGTVGTQTVTMVDEWGHQTFVSVDVQAAPSQVPVPTGLAVYAVQWENGHTVDYYIANDTDLNVSVVDTYTSCSAPGAPWVTGGGSALSARSYGEFTKRIGSVRCWFTAGGYYLSHAIVVDNLGHTWDLPAARYYRFSDVPGNANFNSLDDGDPLAGATFSVTGKSYGVTQATDPTNSTRNFNVVRDGLSVDLTAVAGVRIKGYGYPGQPSITNWAPETNRQPGYIGAGTGSYVFDYIPWGCYFGPRGNGSVRLDYADETSSRDGYRTFGIGDPGVSAPANLCNDPNGGLAYNINGADTGDANPFSLDAFLAEFWQPFTQRVGDPVDVFTGAQTAEVTDFKLGGLTPDLSLTRVYRSTIADALARGKAGEHAQQLLFGDGWASLLDVNLEFPSTVRVDVRDVAGNYLFTKRSDGTWVPSNNSTDALAMVAGGWKISHLDGSGQRFDSNGRLAAIFDANGRELVLGWTSGKLASLTDFTSRVATITTNSLGQVTRIDLPGSRFVLYTYDANGHLHTVQDLGGMVLTYNADVRGRITSVQQGSTVLLTNVFDERGRVVAQSDALSKPLFVAYDDTGLTTSTFVSGSATAVTRTSIDAKGGVTLDCYSGKGLKVGEVDPVGSLQTWTYDQSANVVKSVDPAGVVTGAKYNAKHQPTQVTDGLGHLTSFTWDAFGHPATIANPNALTTTVFDATTHLPLSMTTASGANSLQTAVYTYYAGTNLLATATAQGGALTTYHYNVYGYLDYLIDPAGKKTTFVTDPNTGLVTSSVGPLGNASGGVPANNTTMYTFDNAGRLLTVTDPLGNMAGGTPSAHRTTYTYDAFGRLKTESRASGALTTYNYDASGQITSVVVKINATTNATTTYEYDDVGNLTAVIDPELRRTETTYDLAGRPTSVKDADLKVSTIEYDTKGRVTATEDPTGVRTETTYDDLDRVTSVAVGPDDPTTYTYSPTKGLLTKVTDPLGHDTTYAYDWLGRLESVTNAESETSSITYNSKGFVASATNARLKTTSFTYNDAGQLLTVTEPGDSGNFVTIYTYDDGGRLWKRLNARTGLDTFEYDALGRPTKLTDAVGKVWQSFYANDGQIDHTIDGKSQTTSFAYDLAGRLLAVSATAPTPAITYTYDDSGVVLTMADGNGTTTYGYDPVGRIATVNRAARTTTYAYEDAGRLESVTYPGGQGTVGYVYDNAGRPSTITDWSSRVTTYHYDGASRVTSVNRPGGLTTAYTYDDVDRPLTALSTRSGNTVLSQSWTYDANGNIATLTDDSGTASFTYDNLDRLLTAAYPTSQNYSYTYDSVGNITQAVTPTGTATYAYDLADRITSSGPGGGSQSGSPTQSPTSNNAGWTSSGSAYTSDDAYATAAPAKNQTTSVRLGTFGFDSQIPAGATINSVTVSVEWKVDTTSSIATLGSQVYVSGSARGTELVNSAQPTVDTTQGYTVSGLTRADLLNGAFEVQVRASRGNSNTAFSASLDKVSVQVDWTLAGGSGSAPTYDGNGNMTSDGTYGNRTYAYDTLGRLVSVTAAGATTTYALDGTGNRWSQTTGASTTSFDLDLVNGTTILADGTSKYLPGSPGAGYEAGGTWRNAIGDAIGSPVLYVDTAGATSGLTHYDPYGVPRPGSTATAGVGYAGEYRDGTGLINLRARSYDPVLGRFIGRDTYGGVASAPQTGNRYAYATANPFRYTDPSGHFVQTIIDNPYSVLELAVTFNPVGAALVFGYQLVTGTDPATGAPADPIFAAAGLGVVVAIPVINALLKPAMAALVKGLGHAIGAGIERGLGAGRALGRGISAFAGKLGAVRNLPGRIGDALGRGRFLSGIERGISFDLSEGAAAGSGEFRSLGAAASRDFESATTQVLKVRSPNGRMGGAAHQSVVADVIADIESRGLVARQEVRIVTEGGYKGTRYVDVAGYDPADFGFSNPLELHQVGRVTSVGRRPVAREIRALWDIMWSIPSGTTVHYWPYN